jgi:RNA polymerase sigma factor (sigma-70 family)
MEVAALRSDERLSQLSRSGDEAAFDQIVERYQGPLLRHCARVLGEAQAQDAVQDTFFTAWTALRAGVAVRALRPWLFTIAHRQALATLHDRGSRWSELPDTLTEGSSSADAVDRAARVREALAALAKLPADQRDALVSSAVHGRSGRQIARSLGLDEAAVRQLVHRARTSVRAAAAACLVPPILIGRSLRAGASWIRRLFPGGGSAGAFAGSKLIAVGAAAAVSAAAAGGAALQAGTSHRDHPGRGAERLVATRAARPDGMSASHGRPHAGKASQPALLRASASAAPPSGTASRGRSAAAQADSSASSALPEQSDRVALPSGASVVASSASRTVTASTGASVVGTSGGGISAAVGTAQHAVATVKPVVVDAKQPVSAVTQGVPLLGATGVSATPGG